MCPAADLGHGHARVSVTGEIDHDSAPLLWSAVGQALRGQVGSLEVDLGDVRFCDCAGLNVLLRIRRHAQDNGVAMTLARASTSMRHLLELTETRSLFTLTEPEAPSQANP